MEVVMHQFYLLSALDTCGEAETQRLVQISRELCGDHGALWVTLFERLIEKNTQHAVVCDGYNVLTQVDETFVMAVLPFILPHLNQFKWDHFEKLFENEYSQVVRAVFEATHRLPCSTDSMYFGGTFHRFEEEADRFAAAFFEEKYSDLGRQYCTYLKECGEYTGQWKHVFRAAEHVSRDEMGDIVDFIVNNHKESYMYESDYFLDKLESNGHGFAARFLRSLRTEKSSGETGGRKSRKRIRV